MDVPYALRHETGSLPRLVRHAPLDWHVHAEPKGASLATQIAVETAMAMITLIMANELSRIQVCDDARCNNVVVDLSRNRSKRFCSTAHANRNAVAAYRSRQRR